MAQESLRIDDQPGTQADSRVLRLDGALVMTTMFEFQATVRADKSKVLIIDFTTCPLRGFRRHWGARGSVRDPPAWRTQSRAGGCIGTSSQCAQGYAGGTVLSVFRLGERSGGSDSRVAIFDRSTQNFCRRGQ
jgi:hypothetical protein